MGKRNWGRIARWTAIGTTATVLAGCQGLQYAYSQYQAEDTQAVTTAMTALAKHPVRLIKITDACLDAVGEKSCMNAASSAMANTGLAKFDGAYYAADHQDSAQLAFRACARNHGWSNCSIALDGALAKTQADVIVPADAKDNSKAQLVWMLPGYRTVHVGMAADGKKYFLNLQ